MANVWLTSDTHFGHFGVCKFVRSDGTKLRPWDNPDEMDEYMVKAWNDTVRPKDKIYHLGDVVINRRALKTLARLNGEKVLIRGNHDIFKLEDYTPYFKDIRGCHVMSGIILTHIPVHESNLYRFGCNVHGHTHSNRIMKRDSNGNEVIDERYFCVCVEQTEFKPISLETVKQKIVENGGRIELKPLPNDSCAT
jgi:calcineurin-like phosphoesterase family protein